ncbi:hypothetical protein [Actinoplanes sp. OR16]|uniref:hypothetical protein n=1 Tax=Actinoplanes sp. OR16 TaxID=946334 RepID=UPI000FD72269|nr:hypothetical protein [Actinoplanes sp. OR16]
MTDDDYALDVESLTEHLARPGATAARELVAQTAALPERCPTFETPRYTVHVKPQPMPAIGDASTALRVVFWVKAAGSQTTYVDVMEAEIATVAHGDQHVTVVLLGYYAKHGVDLAAVTRTAVTKA